MSSAIDTHTLEARRDSLALRLEDGDASVRAELEGVEEQLTKLRRDQERSAAAGRARQTRDAENQKQATQDARTRLDAMLAGFDRERDELIAQARRNPESDDIAALLRRIAVVNVLSYALGADLYELFKETRYYRPWNLHEVLGSELSKQLPFGTDRPRVERQWGELLDVLRAGYPQQAVA